MQTIILAAGKGTRLAPLTNNTPKCMLNINSQPVINIQLSILKKFSDKILIVVGYKKEVIMDNLKNESVKFIENYDYATTNSIYSLWLAKYELDDDLLIINSDVLFDSNLMHAFVNSKKDICIALSSIWSHQRGYKVEVLNDLIVNMSTNIKSENIFGEYAGMIFIKKPLLNQFKKYLNTAVENNSNMWFEDVFANMARNTIPINYFDVKNYNWYEFDTVEEYNYIKQKGDLYE